MARQKRNQMQINIEFGSISELQLVLHSILMDAKNGRQHERKSVSGAIYEMHQETVFNESEYREEIINGKHCLIIKSKL